MSANVAVNMRRAAGAFAENKDVAREIRLTRVLPCLEAGGTVTLDFNVL